MDNGIKHLFANADNNTFATMKKPLLILISTVLITAACSDEKAPQSAHKEATETLSPHNKALELRDHNAPVEEIIAMQKKAVDELRRGDCPDDPVEVLSQMGLFCCCAGDYASGAEYLHEASDYLDNHPEHGDTEGVVQLYGDLGNLYITLGMSENALESNDRAIDVSKRLGGRLLSDLYRMRASIFNMLQEPDSVLACYNLALESIAGDETVSDSDELRNGILSERADFIISCGILPDSIPAAISTLERILESEPWDPNGVKYSLGLAYFQTGRTMEGVTLMEEAIDSLIKTQDLDFVSFCYPDLMKSYANAGLYERLGQRFLKYDELRDTLLNREKLASITGADFRHRATQKEEENKILALQLELAQQRILLGCILAIFIFAAISLTFIFQRRSHLRTRRIQQSRIDSLIADRVDLNKQIESLNRDLENRRPELQETTLLTPLILEKEHEAEFKRSFATAYPHFLPELRRDYPDLTPSLELICMLIFLHRSTDEIALAIGISRDSVHKSRYRIRRTLGLGREDDLDSFIQQRRP